MLVRYGLGLIVVGIALGCSEEAAPNEVAAHAGEAGSVHSAGSGHESEFAGAGGIGGGYEPGGHGGQAGAGGAAPVRFWTEETQRIEITCFGFSAGYAIFRADRSQLSNEQLALLAPSAGLPGSTYDSNDDGIHCVVTTTDSSEQQRQFVFDGGPGWFTSETIRVEEGGAGGEGGVGEVYEYPVQSLLGCEFRHPSFDSERDPFPANPFCLRPIETEAKEKRIGLELASPGRYRVELLHCTQSSLGNPTVELFGADPETPLATGVVPDDPGADQVCVVLDAQVDAKVVGRLVIRSQSALTDFHLRFH